MHFFTYSTAFFERWQLAQIALLLFSRAFLGIFIKRDGISCNTGTAKKYGHGYQGGRPAGRSAGRPAGRPGGARVVRGRKKNAGGVPPPG